MKTQWYISLLISFLLSGFAGAENTSVFGDVFLCLGKQKKPSPRQIQVLQAIAQRETASHSEKLQATLLSAIALTAQDHDSCTEESIALCNEGIKKTPNSVQADFFKYIRLVNYGLLGKSEEQISFAKSALEEIDFSRFDTSSDPVLSFYRETYNMSGAMVHNEIKSILGYAYIEKGQFKRAKNTYSSIDDDKMRTDALEQLEYSKLEERSSNQQEGLHEGTKDGLTSKHIPQEKDKKRDANIKAILDQQIVSPHTTAVQQPEPTLNAIQNVTLATTERNIRFQKIFLSILGVLLVIGIAIFKLRKKK